MDEQDHAESQGYIFQQNASKGLTQELFDHSYGHGKGKAVIFSYLCKIAHLN